MNTKTKPPSASVLKKTKPPLPSWTWENNLLLDDHGSQIIGDRKFQPKEV